MMSYAMSVLSVHLKFDIQWNLSVTADHWEWNFSLYRGVALSRGAILY